MAILPEDTWDLRGILGTLAHDFILPRAPVKPKGWSKEQLDALYYPKLTDCTEKLVDTPTGKVNIYYGGNKNGPAMVLWPSLMMKGTMWSYQYEYFQHEYFVVLIDSPGINKSEALRKYIDMHDCKDIFVAILDDLGIEKAIFGGNSWGAMLAAQLPAWVPERLLGTIVTNGTASLPTTPESILMGIRCEALMCCQEVPDWWCSIAQEAFSGESAASNAEFQAYVTCVKREDAKSIAWAIRSILLGRKDVHALLRTIKDVPVLVVAGEEDRQFPVDKVKLMADSIPTAKFVVLPGVAHLASRENPDLVNKTMEAWLKEIGVGK